MNDLRDVVVAFKPAYIFIIGIAALFFYAFSSLGFVILLGVVAWYNYTFPNGVVEGKKRQEEQQQQQQGRFGGVG